MVFVKNESAKTLYIELAGGSSMLVESKKSVNVPEGELENARNSYLLKNNMISIKKPATPKKKSKKISKKQKSKKKGKK